MEVSNNIEYKGDFYPCVEVSYNRIYEGNDSSRLLKVSEVSLWDAIEEDYFNEEVEAIDLDSEIFFYVEDGFLERCSEEELICYLQQYC